MKFWYALHKNLTSQPGRFLYEVGGGSANSIPDPITENVYPDIEINSDPLAREAAIADTEQALSDLQAQIESEDFTPGDLALEDQISLLVRIAHNDSLSDQTEGSGDDRSYFEWARDSLGSVADGYISGNAALRLQWLSEVSTESYILNELSSKAKSQFLSNYREEAQALFTDTLSNSNGAISYRANFYGDESLSRQANFMNLLSGQNPDQQYIQIGDDFYVRTPQGYLGFSPESVVGNRATIGSNTEFTTYSRESITTQKPDLIEALVQVRSESNLFNNIDSPDKMNRLEANRNTNFYTAQTWKGFADTIMTTEIPTDLPFASNLQALFSERAIFRQFLDADTTLRNYNAGNQGISFSIPGFSESAPALSSTADPAEFIDGIMRALGVVQNFAKNEINNYQTAIAAETNPEIQAIMTANLNALLQTMPQFFNNIDTLSTTNYEAYEEMRRANLQLILQEFPTLNESELNQWMNEFDTALAEMAESGEFNQQTLENHMGLVLARILGVSDEEGQRQLSENPRLKSYLLARMNILSRHSGIRDMEAAMEIAQQQFYIRSTIKTLQAINPDLVVGINIESPSEEDLNRLAEAVNQMQRGLEMRIINDDPLSEEETQLLSLLQNASPSLSRAARRIATAENERAAAQAAEDVHAKIRTNAEATLDPSTERGRHFHEVVDTTSEAIRVYARENNGQTPNLTASDMEEVSMRLAQGESPKQIAQQLNQAFREDQPLSNISSVSAIAQNPRNSWIANEQTSILPTGVNFIGTTPNGQYILESPGPDQTTYLQNPTDGTIIAEQLTGVPDSEDLRVPPEEWATAQALAAMTDSFVIKSAAELAQAGETLGNVALVNFMRQYWGIRGHSTLSESELDQFKSLGAMMSDNHINLHTVLQQLNATKWDETAAGNRAVSVRYQFNEILAAAAAGNNTGFRDLLRLDELPSDELKTGPDLIA